MSTITMVKKQLTVKLEGELFDAIKIFAKSLNITMTQAVEQGMAVWVETSSTTVGDQVEQSLQEELKTVRKLKAKYQKRSMDRIPEETKDVDDE